ncbi:Uncharacterized protein FWK35_00001151 [Aphis craccivora]|uniref:Uncharacterized protein n=1 Tax=Aphis craccivora TaxID=307492 RepID=A0A6G0ZQD6_APHCR|nr:Uncharacterized protein FWK35_00001151 [Aphis craccivora]
MLQFQTLGVVSDSKMNLVGVLGRSFFNFPNSFQKRRENPKQNDGKTGIITQNQYSIRLTLIIKELKFWRIKAIKI